MKRIFLSKILVISVFFIFAQEILAAPDALRRTPVVEAVEKAGPAVVNISTEQIVRRQSPFGSSDPFFDQFFRDFFDPFPRREYKQNSLGSGVIIDKRRYVLTNYHVVLKASKITVTLADNREFEGEIVGSDPKSDLAIVKLLTEEDVPVADMGVSNDLMIGEPVIAIGNPFGLSHTITTGVISALDRSIRLSDEQTLRGFIQTDAPINPGNSGGPLINILGDVIGINTAIYSEAQGIGFAIPIDKAKRIISELIEYGKVRAAWVGVAVQDITPAVAQYFKYDSADGVLISQVFKESAAERAGLKQGDIIVNINDQPVRDQFGYQAALDEFTANDTLTMTVFRDGKPLTLEVKAEEFSQEQAIKLAYQEFGVAAEEITNRTAQEYDLQTRQGVLINKVRPKSSAAQVGIEPGDIIRQIEGVPVGNMADFGEILSKIRQQSGAVFLIQRGARGYYVTLERQS